MTEARTPHSWPVRTAQVLAAAAALACLVVPWFSCRFPPITDLPFHAAGASILRHHGDPTFAFDRQFELAPVSVPYLTLYALAAFFMLFLDAVIATKLAAAILLASLPIGLGTLAWGLRKSPWLGLAACPFAWGHLTHWGFINFVSAIGIYLAVVGLALRAVAAPHRRTTALLVLCVVLLHFTHVFRAPFALLSIGLVGACMFPVTRRVAPLLPAMGASALLLLSFWLLKPASLYATPTIDVTFSRLLDVPRYVFDSFHDPWERRTFYVHLGALGLVAVGSVVLRWRAWASGSAADDGAKDAQNERRLRRASRVAAVGCLAGVLATYVTLPMDVGLVWYIFPREATVLVLVSLALLPDLPRAPLARAAALTLLAVSITVTTVRVARSHAAFDAETADFALITAGLPMAPRLSYLIFDHTGSDRRVTPFLHLPAYVQAEKGGWLSFHFAAFDASPYRYRKDRGADVPPPFPPRWEFRPSLFSVREHGAFFDWFLVRSATDPSRVFAADRSIALVDRQGSWWLYERRRDRP